MKCYQTSAKVVHPAHAGKIKRYTTYTPQEEKKKCIYLQLLGKQDSASCKSSYALSWKWLHYSGVAVTVPPPWQTHHLCELAAWQSSVAHPLFPKKKKEKKKHQFEKQKAKLSTEALHCKQLQKLCFSSSTLTHLTKEFYFTDFQAAKDWVEIYIKATSIDKYYNHSVSSKCQYLQCHWHWYNA